MKLNLLINSFLIVTLASCGITQKVESMTEIAKALERISSGERQQVHVDYESEGTILVYHGLTLAGRANDAETLMLLLQGLNVESLGQLSLNVGKDVTTSAAKDLLSNLIRLGLGMLKTST